MVPGTPSEYIIAVNTPAIDLANATTIGLTGTEEEVKAQVKAGAIVRLAEIIGGSVLLSSIFDENATEYYHVRKQNLAEAIYSFEHYGLGVDPLFSDY
jgi:hypothetical protein